MTCKSLLRGTFPCAVMPVNDLKEMPPPRPSTDSWCQAHEKEKHLAGSAMFLETAIIASLTLHLLQRFYSLGTSRITAYEGTTCFACKTWHIQSLAFLSRKELLPETLEIDTGLCRKCNIEIDGPNNLKGRKLSLHFYIGTCTVLRSVLAFWTRRK